MACKAAHHTCVDKEILVVWMALLNELQPSVLVKGLLQSSTTTIIDVKRHGDI